MSICFIILSNANSKEIDDYWRLCYKQIRQYYKHEKIIIIDDNSKYEKQDIPDDVTLLYSEFPGRGELLFYYYFLKYKFADIGIFFHDSIILHNKLKLEHTDTYRFFWDFPTYKGDFKKSIINEIQKQKYHKDILDVYLNKKWKGGFGCVGIFQYNFLKKLEDKHSLFSNMISTIKTREQRMSLERIIPIVLFIENNNIQEDSLYGNIHNYYTTNRWPPQNKKEYLEKQSKKDVEKIWVGR